MRTRDKILILMAAFLVAFVVAMCVIFCFKDSVPDTLITSVFAACTGEASLLAFITNSKIKNGYEETEEEDDSTDSETDE